MRWPCLRQYFSMTWSAVTFKYSARRSISTLLIHTYPGPPVQQLPHCVQLKLRPSRYHGSASVLIIGRVMQLQLQSSAAAAVKSTRYRNLQTNGGSAISV